MALGHRGSGIPRERRSPQSEELGEKRRNVTFIRYAILCDSLWISVRFRPFRAVYQLHFGEWSGLWNAEWSLIILDCPWSCLIFSCFKSYNQTRSRLNMIEHCSNINMFQWRFHGFIWVEVLAMSLNGYFRMSWKVVWSCLIFVLKFKFEEFNTFLLCLFKKIVQIFENISKVLNKQWSINAMLPPNNLMTCVM